MLEKLGQLERKIDEKGLGAAKDCILRLVRPAITFAPELAEENDIPFGSTKLWGLPHVPPEFEWPTHEGMVLGFLGQINLAELKRCYDLGLPSKGLLSFWFHQGLNDGEGPAVGKVFHFPDSDLVLLEWPEDDERADMSWILYQGNTTWKASLIAFPSIPCGYYGDDNVYREFLGLSRDENDAYTDLHLQMSHIFELPRDDYQIGGYPHRGQMDPQKYIYLHKNNIQESEFDKNSPEAMETMLKFARNLRLLAQFDANNENVADQSEASIYFLYPEEKLAQHDFENPCIWWDFES